MTTERTVAVYVGDIQEAKEFYCRELGFEFVAQYDDRILQLKNNGVVFVIERIADHLGDAVATVCTRANGLTQQVARLRGGDMTFVHRTPHQFPDVVYTGCTDTCTGSLKPIEGLRD